MPQPDTTGAEIIAGEPTANHEGTDATATPGTTTTELGTERLQTEQPISAVSQNILDRLGVPTELAEQIGLGQSEEPTPPADPDTATATATADAPTGIDAEPVSPEPVVGEEANGEHDDLRPNKAWAPEVQAEFNKRVGKLTKQRTDERTRAETAEAERDDLRAQLEAAQPVSIVPTEQDPLAWVETPAQLASLEHEADMTLDWCDSNKDGATITQKDGTETEVTPEQVEIMRTKANRALRQIPKRETWIKQRAEADAKARAGYPRIFEKNTTEYQVAQAVMKEIPSIATHPARNLILGDWLVGLGVRLQAEEKAAANGASNGNGNGHAAPVKTADSTNPLTRKIPPVAQHVPRTSSAPAQGGKQVDNAMNNVVASGGDRSAIAAALRAIRNADKTVPSKRAPATV